MRVARKSQTQISIYHSGPSWPQPDDPAGWLNANELDRLRASGVHASAFLHKRWILRKAMGANGDAIEVRQSCSFCQEGNHGQVRLRIREDGRSNSWCVASLSEHAGHAVATVATSPDDLIGIDIVALSEAADPAMEYALSPDELRHTRAAPSPGASRARLWARKEAALKAVGVGLRVDPATICVLGETVKVEGHLLTLGEAWVRPTPAAPAEAVVAWAYGKPEDRSVQIISIL